jgi:hypothetical protein
MVSISGTAKKIFGFNRIGLNNLKWIFSPKVQKVEYRYTSQTPIN